MFLLLILITFARILIQIFLKFYDLFPYQEPARQAAEGRELDDVYTLAGFTDKFVKMRLEPTLYLKHRFILGDFFSLH